jgi:tetratricopeptide (TPR) repeat protein
MRYLLAVLMAGAALISCSSHKAESEPRLFERPTYPVNRLEADASRFDTLMHFLGYPAWELLTPAIDRYREFYRDSLGEQGEADLMLLVSICIMNSNCDSSYAFARRALSVFARLNDGRGEAAANSVIGDLFSGYRVCDTPRNVDSASYYYALALQYYVASGDRYREAWARLKMARTKERTEQFEERVAGIRNALRIFREIDSLEDEGAALSALARSFMWGHSDSVVYYWEEAMKAAWPVLDDRERADYIGWYAIHLYSNGEKGLSRVAREATRSIGQKMYGNDVYGLDLWGMYLADGGDFREAITYYRYLLSESAGWMDALGIATGYSGLGVYDTAMIWYDSAAAMASLDEKPYAMLEIESHTAKDFAKQGKTSDAVLHLAKAMEIARELPILSAQPDILRRFAALHESEGDLSAAADSLASALAILKDLNDPKMRGTVLWTLADLETKLGRFEAAIGHLQQCEHFYNSLGYEDDASAVADKMLEVESVRDSTNSLEGQQ